MGYISPRLVLPAIGVLLLALMSVIILVDVPEKIWPQDQPTVPTPTPVVGSITIEGEVVCLPHKDQDGPQTLECAFGLKSNSGEHFGLRQLDQDQLIDATITTGKRYRVTGESAAPGSDENYAVVGNIKVTTIQLLND